MIAERTGDDPKRRPTKSFHVALVLRIPAFFENG